MIPYDISTKKPVKAKINVGVTHTYTHLLSLWGLYSDTIM